MPAVERAGRSVHFTLVGDGPGVVLVPGLGSGALLFGTLPRRFLRSGCSCAAVDPVGLPPSSPLPARGYDFGDAADDVLAVALLLPRPRALIGTSLGGKVALLAAARAPHEIDRLVLLASAATPTPRARAVYRMFEALAGGSDGHQVGEVLAPFLFGATFHERHPDVVAAIARTPQSAAALQLMRAQARALADFDGADAARRCTVPTLCLAGAEDTLTLPAEVAATASLIPGATHLLIPDAGHSLLLESAAAFAAVIDFVRGADRP
jgi:pimeloyl-ACP methyl ester carboxylesterase